MEKENAYMQQRIDWKKVWLLYWERVWLIICITISIAALSAGVYKVIKALNDEGQFYRVSSDYYITFNFDEHENSVDYYNAYTWDSILRDDPIVDGALEVLQADYTKEEIKSSITGEMLGDYRILTVHATHKNPERAQTIAEAYAVSLTSFADKIDMLDTIEKWSSEECQPVVEEDLTANVVLLGAFLGVVIAIFVLAFWCLLDDSIYVEHDFTECYTVPFLGMLTIKENEARNQELRDNTEYLLKESGEYYLVSVDAFDAKVSEQDDMDSVTERIRAITPKVKGCLAAAGDNMNILRDSAGVVLILKWGSKNGRRCAKLMDFLNKQDCKVAGAIVVDADNKFLKRYYWGKNNP